MGIEREGEIDKEGGKIKQKREKLKKNGRNKEMAKLKG
jgi:hypothetical protein